MKVMLASAMTALMLVAGAAPASAAPTRHITVLRQDTTAHGSKKKVVKRVGSVTGSLSGRRGPRGARGPRGFTGAPGADGAPGATGPAGPAGGFSNALVQYIAGPYVSVLDGQAENLSVTCPAGTKVLGGGYQFGTVFVPNVAESRPLPDGSGWTVLVLSEFGNGSMRAIAVCA